MDTRESIANTEVLYIMKHFETGTVERKIFVIESSFLPIKLVSFRKTVATQDVERVLRRKSLP